MERSELSSDNMGNVLQAISLVLTHALELFPAGAFTAVRSWMKAIWAVD
jgi:hypothetical protein